MYMIIAMSVPSSKCFPFTLKLETGVFKFLPYKERFRKLPFRDGLLWTVGLTRRRNKAEYKK